MANSDKDILITPNKGSSSDDPKIEFKGASSSVGPSTITVKAYPTNNGTVSFEGSAGQLFSVTNNLTSGSIFSVNDVSGIPSIDVDADGTIELGPYGGNIGVGTTNPTQKLDVVGNIRVRNGLYDVYNNVGAAGSVLTSTGAGVSWTTPLDATIPQNSKTSGYTLQLSDVGKHISITTGGVIVPSSVFSAGDVISIYNDSSSDQTITATSVTMYLAGTSTTGNRTLAQRGLCTILCVGSNTFVTLGGGLT
jgi:hypothetical protein